MSMTDCLWTMWLYASPTRVGTLSQNNVGAVPLSEFPSGALTGGGLPKTPEWIKLFSMGLFPDDVGEKTTEERGSRLFHRTGDMRFGGELRLTWFDFNSTDEMDAYYSILKAYNYPYLYIWMNNYPVADKLISTPSTTTMRIIVEKGQVTSNDGLKTLPANWRKFSAEVV